MHTHAMGQRNYEIEWRTVSIKSITIFLLVVAALSLFLSYKYWISPNLTQERIAAPVEESFAARFIDYEGRVEVKPKDKYGWISASLKTELREQDRIRTHSDASARIRFEDGTEITIQSNSIVVLNRQLTRRSGSVPLLEIETGRGDINAEKSRSSPSVKTARINRVTFSQGGGGSVEVDSRTGENRTSVRQGDARLDIGDKTVTLSRQEEATLSQDNQIKKVRLPGTPRVYAPQDGQIFEFVDEKPLNIDLMWREVTGAASYQVQVADHSLFAKLREDSHRATGGNQRITVPFTGKKQYYWRIRAIDGRNNAGNWTSANIFVVQPARRSTTTGKKGPPITITYMHPFLPYLQIDGKTAPESFLTLNGEVIDVKEDGVFIYTYTLRKTGLNDLVFVAEDPQGNRTTIKRQYTYGR